MSSGQSYKYSTYDRCDKQLVILRLYSRKKRLSTGLLLHLIQITFKPSFVKECIVTYNNWQLHWSRRLSPFFRMSFFVERGVLCQRMFFILWHVDRRYFYGILPFWKCIFIIFGSKMQWTIFCKTINYSLNYGLTITMLRLLKVSVPVPLSFLMVMQLYYLNRVRVPP